MYKNIQIRVPESGHAAGKYFTETVKFERFLKIKLSNIFPLKVVLMNKYDQKKSYFLNLSLVMQQLNISINFRNFISFLK